MPPALSLFFRWLPVALLTLAAFWLRTHELARRPMHADEANQAVKLGELLDAGQYAFDPRDHHGPTLYYAAVPVAWIRGEHSLAALTEKTVRLVPALFGTVSVLLLAALAAPLGRWPALAAAAFLAVSPPAVYYSRYFIQETLLVTFTLATLLCARTWWRTGLTRWAVLAGGFAGLMQATKASAPLFLALALLAFFIARPSGVRPATRRPRRDLLIALGSAFFAAALLYSSFFTHLAGVRDALGAYGHALTRFGAEASPTGHEKPFGYYFALFGWFRSGGLVWHQVAFSALAGVGLILALVQRRRAPLLLFAAVFSVCVLLTFSLFAYKTPWHAVHFVPGLSFLAAAALAAIARLNTGRLVAVAFALITLATLYQQTLRVAFLRPADQRNPYAYVHSSPDVLKYRALADAAIARAPALPVLVVSEEYWPLPWYLRGIPRVGYYSTPPEDCDGALIIASPVQAEALRMKLKRTYRETFLGLRPGVVCIIFTPSDGLRE
ncbi:MAG: flippase activity-associated protein Agl23 [Verrucomicrobiota bacterium]